MSNRVDPIRLWASPSSRSYNEFLRYNDYFGPFYRTSQVIATLRPEYANLEKEIYSDVNGKEFVFGQVLNSTYWPELMDLQRIVLHINLSYFRTLLFFFNKDNTYIIIIHANLTASEVAASSILCSDCDGGLPMNVTYDDVCLNPLSDESDETLGGCAVFSAFEYWENDWERVARTHTYYPDRQNKTYSVETTYKDHFLYCAKTPSSLTDKFTSGESCMAESGSPVFPFLAVGGYTDENFSDAKALILTFMVRNFVDRNSDDFKKAERWETAFLDIMKEKNNKFKYWDVAFFSERSIEDVIEESSQSDLIIFVISYVLIFAYIMVALGKYDSCSRIPIDAKITLALGGIFMILLSAFAATGVFGWANVASNLIVMEVVPFLLLAVGADNVFILVMDIQREDPEGKSIDDIIAKVLGRGGPSMMLCALTEMTVFFIGALSEMPALKVFAINAGLAILFNFVLQLTGFLAVVKLDMTRQWANRWDVVFCVKSKGEKVASRAQNKIDIFFKKYYTPALMHDLVRFTVIMLFAGLTSISLFSISKATVGLDQDLSVPEDSYVFDYFNAMESYLNVGVPVYFVLEGNFSYDKNTTRDLVCGAVGCDLYSLVEQVNRASKQSNFTTIETAPSSWIDDYVDWLMPKSKCCRHFVNDADDESHLAGDFCPANYPNTFFGEDRCANCLRRNQNEPSEANFTDNISSWLIDNPNEICSKGGHAAYGNSVYREEDDIMASQFMAYHSICIKSEDCQRNLEAARVLANNITERFV